MPYAISDKMALHNNAHMPRLGLGTFTVPDEQVRQAVLWALEIGYRHIDTAAIYGNESGVGEAVRQSGVPRSDVFVTTKVWNEPQRQGPEAVRRAFHESLHRLGSDYVDLCLLHWPVPGGYKDAWRELERLQREGLVKAIGVSNFMVHHLEDLLAHAEVTPAANQVEFHPRLQVPDVVRFCRDRGIQVVAWAPLMKGRLETIPELRALSARYGRTAAQIVLRWNLQRGIVTIPKSVRRERLLENARLYDFELTPDDVALIDGLDRHERMGPDPDNFSF